MDFSSFLLVLAPVVYGLGIVGAVHAVITSRTSQGALAWALSLVYLPFIALPLYAIFGRGRFVGYVEARRASEGAFESYGRALAAVARNLRAPAPEGFSGITACERLARMPVISGNRATLLIDGEATFEAIFEAIERAEHYVLLAFYTVRDDGLGRRLRERLAARARAGVRICLLYDEFGSHALSWSYLGELERAGVRTSPFNSSKGPTNRLQVNFRNHRKIVVVDGRVAFLGGHNVGDEYLGRDPAMSPWRDTHIRIEGPAALACQLVFAEDWNWATGELLEVDWSAPPGPQGTQDVLIVPSGPADELETCALLYTHAITEARRRVWIVSPYFVPDIDILTALKIAALRGVDVRVLVPEIPDHWIAWLAAFAYFGEVQDAGVRIHRYTGGFLHQKVMLIDDTAATVGTVNLDNRSFRLNFEITALVLDRGFATEVAAMLERDFANSYLYDHATFRHRPLWVRLGAQIARLASPVL
ncbi:MAG TPA: cardiolipin synthase [Thermohalobaculum sp.]|nr:cardiolipin synthase [Thermohalobaculum sp.]